MELGDGLKKLLLAGVGTVAVTAEKSREILDELVKKGELTVEQGKTLNEELKHNIKQKVKESVNVEVVKEADTNDILNKMDDMSAEDLAAIKEKLENQLAALKRESKDVVAELKANEQVADVYSNLDRLRASTGTDKMLDATRDGLQESREKAAGAKVLYQTSREGKLDKADANTADYKVSSYLDSLKKSNPNVTTYSIPDLNTLTKSSGLNTQSKK